jgi:type IV pilus assembly protein PilC
LKGGMSLAEAMKRHPKVFDGLFCNMIAAGEAGGILDTILKRLATYIEKARQAEGAGQVRDDLSDRGHRPSPAVVIGVILWKVIPTFAALFAGLGAELPLPTRIVIGLSNNLVRFMPFIVIGFFAAGWGLRTYYATDKGRHVIDALTLKMPILGPILGRSPWRASAARCRR